MFFAGVDKFSKHMYTKELTDKNAITFIQYIRERNSCLGKQKKLVADNEFNMVNVKEFLRQESTEIHFTSPKSHTGNSDISRAHSSLLEHIRTLTLTERDMSISEKVLKATEFYNTTIHSTINCKPLDVQLGQVDKSKIAQLMQKKKEKWVSYCNKIREQQQNITHDKVYIKNYVNERYKEEPKYRKARGQKTKIFHKGNLILFLLGIITVLLQIKSTLAQPSLQVEEVHSTTGLLLIKKGRIYHKIDLRQYELALLELEKNIAVSGRQRSDVWSYFSQKENVKTVCNICKAEISFKSTITNLKSHLKRKHVGVYTELVSKNCANDNSQNSSGSVIPLDSETATINTESAETIPQPNVSVPVIPSASSGQNRVKRQRTIGSYIAKEITSHQKNLIDRDLLDLFVKEFHPSFRKVIKWIPGYELPSRKTISTTMIPALYQSYVENVRDLVSREAISVCLTIDCWTSANNENYMATTAHFITEGFTFKTIIEMLLFKWESYGRSSRGGDKKYNIGMEFRGKGKLCYFG
ncbi:unnamed protein product [Hermetia illucens]|uniref:Uncharacterized protein n=1 Tax=Hermetia illucens TaxID=343691 RepID=A0A7R8YQF9_HERIL|nr:unnamed protein product [Hermetia illucens]